MSKEALEAYKALEDWMKNRPTSLRDVAYQHARRDLETVGQALHQERSVVDVEVLTQLDKQNIQNAIKKNGGKWRELYGIMPNVLWAWETENGKFYAPHRPTCADKYPCKQYIEISHLKAQDDGWRDKEEFEKHGTEVIGWVTNEKGFQDVTARLIYIDAPKVKNIYPVTGWYWGESEEPVKCPDLIKGVKPWPNPSTL